MTTIFDPTFGIRETSKNCKNFVKKNFNFFIYLLIPLAPFLFLSDMLLGITFLYYPEPHVIWAFPFVLMSYFNTCLAVAWHRAVIWETNRSERINPFNPDLGVLKFIGVSLVYILIIIVPTTLLIMADSAFDSYEEDGFPLLVLTLLFCLFMAIFITIRISIVFPSVATEGNLRIKDAYTLSKGLTTKLFFTPLWALLPLSILSLLYIGITSTVYENIAPEFFSETANASATNIVHNTVYCLFSAPSTLFLDPLILVLGVTVLSNYYQWIMQKGNRNAVPIEE